MIAGALLDRFRGVRVLVAGATGFIGRAVARLLSDLGAELALPARDTTDARSLFDTLGVSGNVTQWDARDLESLARALEEFRPAVVFNGVGYGVDPGERDPALAEVLNERFAGQLADLVLEHREEDWGGQALVHLGSALEYGTAEGDLDESTPPTPTTLYGRTKLAGTGRVAAIASESGLPALTARVFTVYGPGERRGRLLPSLLDAAHTGRTLALTEGRQRRDFTYVGDIAEGLLRLALSDARPGEIVNLATGRLLEVREFVQIAGRVLGIPSGRLRLGDLPTRPEEMVHDHVNIERLLRRTGWRPSTRVEEGVRLTAADEARTGAEPTT